MITHSGHTSPLKNTSHKVVIPFYLYAAISFLVSVVLLFFSVKPFTGHHFHPHILAITHAMALGWGTMIILGASHQLVPVLIESGLASNFLAYLSFLLAAIGIPLLVWSFYHLRFDNWAITGGSLVNAAIVSYLLNIGMSIARSRKRNVHAVFIITATVWLLATTIIGLLLVMNFKMGFLPKDSLHYLSLHAHMGIAGWFLLLVLGVGSRLIPMFLISKYENGKQLWKIYFLVNGGLAVFIILFLSGFSLYWQLLPVLMFVTALVLFGMFCRNAYKLRLRKQVDEPMKISLLSVLLLLLPVLLILVMLIVLVFEATDNRLVFVYGFSIFFGWLTAIILGMTFKTLPFIAWNRVYHQKTGTGKTPTPKDLFSEGMFRYMAGSYLLGFAGFIIGIVCVQSLVMQLSAILLLVSALLYNLNIFKMLEHKPSVK